MSAPVSRKERVRSAVALPNNSCPASRETCLRRQRELKEDRTRISNMLFSILSEYFEQRSPGPCNDFRVPEEGYFENLVALSKLAVSLRRAVDSLIEWNADVMAGRATL